MNTGLCALKVKISELITCKYLIPSSEKIFNIIGIVNNPSVAIKEVRSSRYI